MCNFNTKIDSGVKQHLALSFILQQKIYPFHPSDCVSARIIRKTIEVSVLLGVMKNTEQI